MRSLSLTMWSTPSASKPANGRGKKVLVFKFKRKKQYKRTIGHRQDYTAVQVGDIKL